MQRSVMLATLSLFCVSLAACDFTPPTPLPTVLSPTATAAGRSINITHQDYEQAVAKWESLGIEEYTMQVEYNAYSFIMGAWTLHVRLENDKAEVIDYIREPGPAPPVGGLYGPDRMPTEPAEIQYLKEELSFITIESQLHQITEALNSSQNYCCMTVRFDPETGRLDYVGFSSEQVTEPWSWTLKSFTTVKRATPQAR